jgi:hypothetical protein
MGIIDKMVLTLKDITEVEAIKKIMNKIVVIAIVGLILYLCFHKDKCQEYSDFTCKQIDEADYNVYFRYPNNDQDYYLGQVTGLQECGYMAKNHAFAKNLSYNREWSYICCMIAKGSQCYEKHR